ncbi:MAG: type II toxin-antitoxin system VapC family toxin [Blastocatellia bacterium]
MSRKTTTPAFNLIDTGPLVALLNRNDPSHSRAAEVLQKLPKRPLLTTCQCLTEAMYLLHRAGGHDAQEELWEWIIDGLLQTYELTDADERRARELMKRYADTPMDYADASLVATAESLNLRRIFTFDGDFYIYRLADGSMLEVIR